MLAEAIGMAAVSFAVGLGLILLGTGLAVPQRLESAGRFDIAVGVAILLYGAVLLGTRPSGVWSVFPLFFGYFLAGLALFRRGYILSTFQSQRARDVMTSILISLVGVIGMGGLTGGQQMLLKWLSVPSLLIGVFGGVLFLLYTVLALRHRQVYQRDVVGALMMMFSLLLFYILFTSWFTIRSTVA